MKKLLSVSLLILLMGLIVTGLIGCGSTESEKKEGTGGAENTVQEKEKPEVVTIGYMVGPDDEMLVKAKGWYEADLAKEGIKLKYVQFDAGRDINNAMVSHSIDIALIGTVPPAVGIAQKIPYYIYWLDNIAGDSEGLTVKKTANINSLKDLKGKKVATTIGSTSHFSLLNALKQEGIKPEEVTILDMLPPDIIAAWQRGDIDATYTWQPNLDKLKSDGKILLTSKDLAAKGIITGSVGIVHKDFAEKYPDLVTLYIKFLAKAYDLYKSNPDEAAEAIAKELGITKDEAKKQMSEVIWLSREDQLSNKYLGTSSSKGQFIKVLEDTGNFLVEQKSLEKAPETSAVEAAVNPEFIEQSLK